MHKLGGFTLLEILVAVAVAVILLTVGIPSFSQFIQDNRRAAQVNEFIAAMTLTRSEALKRGNRVSLCRTSGYADSLPDCGEGDGWEDGWIIFTDENSDGNPDQAGDVLHVHEPLGGGITLRGDHNVATRIHYAPSGRMAGTFGNLSWCDQRGPGAQARRITFPLSGRVRVSRGTAGMECDP